MWASGGAIFAGNGAACDSGGKALRIGAACSEQSGIARRPLTDRQLSWEVDQPSTLQGVKKLADETKKEGTVLIKGGGLLVAPLHSGGILKLMPPRSSLFTSMSPTVGLSSVSLAR